MNCHSQEGFPAPSLYTRLRAWLTSVILFACYLAAGSQAHASVSVVSSVDTWRFEQNSNLDGLNWQSPAFDDSLWQTGLTAFFVETNVTSFSRKTELTLGRTTYYFRKSFSWPFNPTNVVLQFGSAIDDGAVFYLNGQEIKRLRMPSAPISYTNFATATPSSGDATYFEYFDFADATGSVLRTGTNVLAVEVHQESAGSDDVVFASSLSIRFVKSPPVIVQQPYDVTVVDGKSTYLLARVDGDPAPAVQWFKDGSPLPGADRAMVWFPLAHPTNAGTYFFQASNVIGTVTSSNMVLTVLNDTNAPVLVSAIGEAGLTNVQIRFSESLSATASENFELYQTVFPSNRLEIFSVSLSNSDVLLHTSARIPGAHYTLRVNGLKDNSSTHNPMASNSEIALKYRVQLVRSDPETPWRYFQSGVQPASDWKEPIFNDASWPMGPATFAAGSPLPVLDDPVRTTLSLTAGGNPITTYYFRTTFLLPGTVETNSLTLRCLVDDGAAFYLNGSESSHSIRR